MEDIFKSIKAYLYDRTTSPLFGAFATAWSLWNYRLITILLSSDTINNKFTEIDSLFKGIEIKTEYFSFSIYGELIHGFIIPTIATLIYLYIYPLLAKPVYEHSLKKQKVLREIKQKDENNRLLSIEESRELYKKLSLLQSKHDQAVEDYTKQISSLTQTISELENELSTEVSQADRLRQTEFDDADPEEYDPYLRKNINSLPDMEFQLSDLFSTEQWTQLSSTNKQSIGKRFKKLVARGDYPNISALGKGTGNQQIYVKSSSNTGKTSNSLPKAQLEILKQFAGLKINHGITSSMLHDRLGGHIDEIRMYVEDLDKNNYIEYLAITDNDETLYQLATKGRKYLHDKNLLSTQTKKSA